MPKSGKVFCACAAGALIGTLVALELAGLFWWVGLFVGAIVGYLAYEPTEIAHAAPGVWRLAVRESSAALPSVVRALKIVGCYTAVSFSLSTTAYLLMVGLLMGLWAMGVAPHDVPNEEMLSIIAAGGAKLGVPIFFLAFIWSSVTFGIKSDLSDLIAFARKASIFSVCFVLLPRAVIRCIPHIPTVFRALFIKFPAIVGRFAWHLFVAIHSDLRVLCAVDAAIGASAEYLFYRSALIGAMVGGVFGIANYLIITKWWLKIISRS